MNTMRFASDEGLPIVGRLSCQNGMKWTDGGKRTAGVWVLWEWAYDRWARRQSGSYATCAHVAAEIRRVIGSPCDVRPEGEAPPADAPAAAGVKVT